MCCFAQLIVHGLIFKAYFMGYYPNPKAVKDWVNILKNSGAHLKFEVNNFFFQNQFMISLASESSNLVIVEMLISICLVFTCSVTKNSMYQMMQPQIDILLFEIIFPLMCFNDNDQKLWDEDPHEYVRKGYGEFTDLCISISIRMGYY